MKDLLSSLRTATSAPDPSHGNSQLLAGILFSQRSGDVSAMNEPKQTIEELRGQKEILDRMMEVKRLSIQSSKVALANLRRDKKRVMELIFNLGSNDPPPGMTTSQNNKQQK